MQRFKLNYGWEMWTLDYKLKRALFSKELIFGEELQGLPNY
jgi:hypothetical protein